MTAAEQAGWREPFPHLDAAWRAELIRRLRGWYRRAQRDLPWRRKPSPYRVWVSEIMLQQTQVATVVPYFQRFVRAFPTVRALAAADEAAVLRLWEGLGYYRRARQLHAAAREIVARHRGRLPTTLTELQALPGIGRYTAGAIVSIGQQRPAPILEANTQRLYCRLLAWDQEPRTRRSQDLLWTFADWILPRTRPGDLNQALMELGSVVCTPRQPNCPACPLRTLCPTWALRATERIPPVARRPATTRLRQAAILIRRGEAWLLRQAGRDERWAGLWDFLRVDFPAATPLPELAAAVADQTGLRTELAATDCQIQHQVTRYQIELHAVIAASVGGRVRAGEGRFRWFRSHELSALPLNVTGRKLVRQFVAPTRQTPAAPAETQPATGRRPRAVPPAGRRAAKR